MYIRITEIDTPGSKSVDDLTKRLWILAEAVDKEELHVEYILRGCSRDVGQ